MTRWKREAILFVSFGQEIFRSTVDFPSLLILSSLKGFSLELVPE